MAIRAKDRAAVRGAKVIAIGLSSTLWAAGFAAAFAQAPSTNPVDVAVPVRIVVAAPTRDAGRVVGSGTLTYKREVALSFKTGGVVKSYAVDVGDVVKSGQALVNADPTDVAGRRSEAEAAFQQAKSNLARAEQLTASGFVSEARLEDARTAFQRAQAALGSARFDESRSALVAPADGVVLVRHAEAGQQLPAGQPVITIGDASSGLILTVPVSDRDIVRIRTGDRAEIRMPSLGRLVLAGRVNRLAAKADRVTGAYDIEVLVEAGDAGLRSGLVGQVLITPTVADASQSLIAVPALALLEGRGDLAYVYVAAADDRALRVAVTIDQFLGEVALLRQGLKPGDRVVTSGAAYLRNGQKVAIVAGGSP